MTRVFMIDCTLSYHLPPEYRVMAIEEMMMRLIFDSLKDDIGKCIKVGNTEIILNLSFMEKKKDDLDIISDSCKLKAVARVTSSDEEGYCLLPVCIDKKVKPKEDKDLLIYYGAKWIPAVYNEFEGLGSFWIDHKQPRIPFDAVEIWSYYPEVKEIVR